MKIGISLCLGVLMCLNAGCTGKKSAAEEPELTYSNPLSVQFGDPYVLLASDGRYYMYGTGAGAVDGFCAYSSDDLIHWKSEGQVYRGNTPDSWAIANFWAPEVYERDGKFYMFFSADWRNNPTNEEENFRIGVAVSDKPTGPFKELADAPLFDPGDPVTDESIFPKFFLFNNFVILKKFSNRGIFVFLCIEHEFKVLDVHRISFIPYSGKCFVDSHL